MSQDCLEPLPVGTRVAIDIAQGDAIAEGTVVEIDWDDGWMYRVEVTAGDDCDRHREDNGELWLGDFEVTPAGAVDR